MANGRGWYSHARYSGCWRRLFLIDNDDDGEDAAGGRLAHLLEIMVNLLVSPEMLINEGHQKCYACRQQVVRWHHVAW